MVADRSGKEPDQDFNPYRAPRIGAGILFGFGFAMQPFTDQKQALHDMMSGTLVERR